MIDLSSSAQNRFNTDGFVVVDKLIESATLPILHQAFEDLFSGKFETGVRPDEVNWQQSTGDPSLSRQICNGWKANRDIARVVLSESIGKAIANLVKMDPDERYMPIASESLSEVNTARSEQPELEALSDEQVDALIETLLDDARGSDGS